MYHINPACTKRILTSMPKSEIPAEMEKIKQKVIETPPGNERNKFIRLYQWCEKLNPCDKRNKTPNNTNGVH